MDKNGSKGRVVVAMSGGVDSSVAAVLLKEQGYDVVGVTMRLFAYDQADSLTSYNKGCCTPEDVDDARRVCQIIGVPHYLMNFEREFQAHVIDYFCQEYARGRTPHPCLACNDKIKFNFLLQRALAMDADYVATGHYARVGYESGQWHLLKGIDPAKDQSYVLFTLRQQELEHTLLPVGVYPKSEIRAIALRAGLPVANKPDSQEICFIQQGDYRSFLAERLKPQPGEIVDSHGNVLGHHQGIEQFTVGQRRGLGLASSKPIYVLGVNAETRRVIVGTAEELLQGTLWASQVNYPAGAPEGPVEVRAKIRYKASEVPATLYPRGSEAVIRFQEPQRAVTPGQAVAFYVGEELLGGGIIEGAWDKALGDPVASARRAS
ncbi:MAG: tRNA 2-thiouridine(34) synthase MnmA [Dehalococcoidia bacterium]|nr:tRNA 2-thiouridine(34) synthase MnmA [Dehalococcoidia bacterium]